MSALSTSCRAMLACMSSATPMGTSGPTVSRTRRTSSPSASSQVSDTAAPCNGSSTASQGPLSRIAAMMRSKMKSVACAVIAPIGISRAKNNGTSSTCGSCAAAAKNPASVDCELAYSARIAAAPSSIPARRHRSRLAGIEEKVFDSCWNPAVAIRIIAAPRPKVHVGALSTCRTVRPRARGQRVPVAFVSSRGPGSPQRGCMASPAAARAGAIAAFRAVKHGLPIAPQRNGYDGKARGCPSTADQPKDVTCE